MRRIRVRLVHEGRLPGPWCTWIGTAGDGRSIQVAVPQPDGSSRLRAWPLVGNRIEVENGTELELLEGGE